LLFDCDGTLADTMGLHYEAWRETVEPLGLSFPHARYTAMAGRPTRHILETLGAEQGIPVDVDRLLPEKERRFVERMSAVKRIPEVVSLLEGSHGRVPVAVVSGGFAGRSSVPWSTRTSSIVSR
jgi:beta-phosphoglucomutase-like phosphatase (HAD superfamily)